MSNTIQVLQAIKDCLSHPRVGTYESATQCFGASDPSAIALYAWNAQVSSALLTPLHICEVVVRNAVSDALGGVYGPQWPWNNNFIRSLSNPPRGAGVYNPRADLTKVASRQPSTGKVIPELKFVFWQEMFTHRYDARLWDLHLKRVFPKHDPSKTMIQIRGSIYDDLEHIRKLRNRIAHHEPIFARDLVKDFERIRRLVELRDHFVASWMLTNQNADSLLTQKPVFRGGYLWIPAHEEIEKVAYNLWIHNARKGDGAEGNWFEAKRLLGLFD
jgi:hypothetical protein